MADPFIDREDLSDLIGRDVTADPGALIAVDAACDICRTVAEQTFNKVTSTITLDGAGTDLLVLPQRPVVKVRTVLVAGVAATDFVSAPGGMLFRKPGVWPLGRQNVKVTYDHGYDEVPTDVRYVALAIAARAVLQGPAMAESVGDVNVRYAASSTDLTVGERLVLTKYRAAG